MKVLVLGASGFIGQAVVQALSKDHEVFAASPNADGSRRSPRLDLLNKENIRQVLEQVRPDVIVNCAGVVENSDKAKLNVKFTANLLQAVNELNLKPHIIILGSASEYGEVDRLPVSEQATRRPASVYGQSKIDEINKAMKYHQKHGLRLTVARIFNPIGPGMNSRLLLPSLLRQVEGIKQGGEPKIEISRLDSERDYIDVRDVASAIKILIDKKPAETIYNVGSGRPTSNRELIEILIKHSGLKEIPKLIETVSQPEPQLAAQANVSRLSGLGWKPEYNIEDTIQDLINAPR